MQVNPTGSTHTAANSTENIDATKSLGKDDFLKLLITQLRYQDPINPVEDKEFIAQMAQFSSLEQMQNLTSSLNLMMESQQRLTALGQATSMIGKIVEILTDEQESLFGKVSGIQFKEGWPELVVDGKLYSFHEVVSIFEESVEDGE